MTIALARALQWFGLLLVMGAGAACPLRAQRDSAVRDFDAAGGLDAFVYTAALDSVVTQRAGFWGGRPERLKVVKAIYWRPRVVGDTISSTKLGPVPDDLVDVADRVHLEVDTVSETAVTHEALLKNHVPVIILGPIDYLATDDAVLHMTLVTGPRSEEEWVVRVRKRTSGWRTSWISLGYST